MSELICSACGQESSYGDAIIFNRQGCPENMNKKHRFISKDQQVPNAEFTKEETAFGERITGITEYDQEIVVEVDKAMEGTRADVTVAVDGEHAFGPLTFDDTIAGDKATLLARMVACGFDGDFPDKIDNK